MSSRRPLLRAALHFVFAAVMLAGAVSEYRDLAVWEQAGRPGPGPDSLWSDLYALGGKPLVAGFYAAVAVLAGGLGLRGYLRDQALVRRRTPTRARASGRGRPASDRREG